MARIRLVGDRRRKIELQKVYDEQQEEYSDAVVDEVDPNVHSVEKLQKRLKLFREIAGDSDVVGNKCMFCVRFARCHWESARSVTVQNRKTVRLKLIPQSCMIYLRRGVLLFPCVDCIFYFDTFCIIWCNRQ